MKSPLKITSLLIGILACPLIAQSAPVGTLPTTLPPASGEKPIAPPLPAGYKATLHFARKKVAAGAIRQAAHQSEFWIEVRDGKGQPKSGVAIALPTITSGGQTGLTDEELAAKVPTKMSAKLEWLPTAKRVPPKVGEPSAELALTDKEGKVHGIFTSGQCEQTVEFSIVGGSKASIQQVWNEEENDFEDEGVNDDEPSTVRYTMDFKEGDKKVKIVGHHLEMKITSIEFSVSRLTGNIDEEGNPEVADDSEELSVVSPDSDTPQTEQDKALWEIVKNWCSVKPMREVEDGVYEGAYKVTLPAENFVLGQYQIYGVSNVSYDVMDNDAYEDN